MGLFSRSKIDDVPETEQPPPVKPVLPSVGDAYRMGRDYAMSGPNEDNCHFRLFATPGHTRAWEKGKADAATGKQRTSGRRAL
jgi:hypothetical protein